jgi:predicted transcriptional regulator
MKKLESSLIINPSLKKGLGLTQKTLEAIKNTNDNNKEYKEELNKLVEEMNKKTRLPTYIRNEDECMYPRC